MINRVLAMAEEACPEYIFWGGINVPAGIRKVNCSNSRYISSATLQTRVIGVHNNSFQASPSGSTNFCCF